MKIRKIVIGTVLAIVSLSVVSVLIVVASIAVLDRTNGTIVSSGQKREYLLYVPSSYDRAKATSLVISMHGAAVWPAHQMNASRWNRLAESHGFIVVYPAGFHEGPRIWHVERGAGLMRDVRCRPFAKSRAPRRSRRFSSRRLSASHAGAAHSRRGDSVERDARYQATNSHSVRLRPLSPVTRA